MMTRTRNPHLGDSWVDGDDSDVSWDSKNQSPSSESDASQPKRKTTANTKTAANGYNKASQQSTSTGPELIMPSIEGHLPRLRRSTPSTTTSQPRQRVTKSRLLGEPSRKTALYSGRVKPSSNTMDTVVYYLAPILDWIFDVLVNTLRFLKKPISIVFALYLFAGLVTLVANLLTSSIYTALSPICRIPGVSLLGLPICTYHSTDPAQPTLPQTTNSHPANPEFSSLMNTQSQFSEILDSSTNSLSLPLDMKRSETSIRDLRQIVRFSSLGSRHELTLEFDGFIETARIASYDLQKFNSHVGRAVDIVLSTARWTERVLDDIAHKSSKSNSFLPSIISSLLTPFQPVPFTPSLLLDQYITHTRVISDEINNLISEAQALLLVLQSLEDRLDVIHSISLSNSLSAQVSKDEVLSHLWTMLGGNRAQLSKYNKQLQLLRHVGEYRKIAFAHVSATILKLQAMGAELEDLRMRVGSAELQRDYGKEEVPLEVHIESIRMGVERLEAGRERAREVERGHVRRVLGDGGERAAQLEGSGGGRRLLEG
jgi:hypothetical protein